MKILKCSADNGSTDNIDVSCSAGTHFNAYVSPVHNNKLSGQASRPRHFSHLYD